MALIHISLIKNKSAIKFNLHRKHIKRSSCWLCRKHGAAPRRGGDINNDSKNKIQRGEKMPCHCLAMALRLALPTSESFSPLDAIRCWSPWHAFNVLTNYFSMQICNTETGVFANHTSQVKQLHPQLQRRRAECIWMCW